MKQIKMEDEKIRYKDLSLSNKFAIVGGWISLIVFSLSFLIGLMEGFLGL